MKTAQTNRLATIAAALRKATQPVNASDIAEMTGIPVKTIYNQMGNVRARYPDGWQQSYVGRVTYYSIGKELPRRAGFTLPPDLWRGWRNPVTGYQPAQLGAL